VTAVAGASVRLVLVGILGGSWLFDQKGCTQLKQLAMNALPTRHAGAEGADQWFELIPNPSGS
jgi:hypothetical protein